MGIFKRGKSTRKKGISLGESDDEDYDATGLLDTNSNSNTSGTTVDSFADFTQEIPASGNNANPKRRSRTAKIVEEWKKSRSTANIDSLGDDFYDDPNMNFEGGGLDDMSAEVSYLNDDISAVVDDDESRCSTYLEDDGGGNAEPASFMSPMGALRKKQQTKKKTAALKKKLEKKPVLTTLDEAGSIDEEDEEDEDSSRADTTDDDECSSSSGESNNGESNNGESNNVEYESFFAYLDKEKQEDGSTPGKKEKTGKKKKKDKDKKKGKRKKGKKKKKSLDSSASNLNDSASDLLNMVSPEVSERKVFSPDILTMSPESIKPIRPADLGYERPKPPTPADLGYEIAKHGNADVASAARRAIRRSSLGRETLPTGASQRKSRFDQILEGGERPRHNRRRSVNMKLSQSEID